MKLLFESTWTKERINFYKRIRYLLQFIVLFISLVQILNAEVVFKAMFKNTNEDVSSYAISPIEENWHQRSTDRFNEANSGLWFNGQTSGGINYGSHSQHSFSAEFTLSTWIRYYGANAGGSYKFIAVREGEFWLAIDPNHKLTYAVNNVDPGWVVVETDIEIPTYNTSLITMTYNRGLIKIYINGIENYSYQGSGNIEDRDVTNNDLWIGNRSHKGHPYNGIMDDFILFNNALSVDQVMTEFITTTPGIEQELVFSSSMNTDFKDDVNPLFIPRVDKALLINDRNENPNSAVLFNGVDSRVDYGNRGSYDFTGSNIWNFSTWFRVDGPGNGAYGGGGILVNKEGEYEVAIFQDGTIRYALRVGNNTWFWVNTEIVPSSGQWHHLVVTYRSKVALTYLNGKLVHRYVYNIPNSLFVDYTANPDPLWLGDRSGTDQNFHGAMDKTMLFRGPGNHILEGYEVALLAMDYNISQSYSCNSDKSYYLGLSDTLELAPYMFSSITPNLYDSVFISPTGVNVTNLDTALSVSIVAFESDGTRIECQSDNNIFLRRNVDESGCTGAIGDVKYSVLDYDSFVNENGDCWVPLDGRTVKRDKLGAMGYEKIPDGRGLFIRAHDNRVANRVDKDRPFGTPVGTKQQDAIIVHQHSYTDSYSPIHSHKLDHGSQFNGFSQALLNEPDVSETTGGSEVRPKNINFHTYIRIR